MDLALEVDVDGPDRGKPSRHNLYTITIFLGMSTSKSRSKSRSRTEG
jgi:hypothetical protein